ncbi:MAG TPA: membrane dipeptidase [Steroidobacteraceae bacterium]
MSVTSGSPTPANPQALRDLPSLKDAILCDILAPTPPAPDLRAELQARQKTGFSFVSLTMSVDDDASPASVYSRLAQMRHELSKQPDKIVIVDTVADIRAAKKANKLGLGFHFQGTEAVGRDLANVGAYYKLGVRWILMAHNSQNNVGTGCIEAEKNDLGLSAFGKDLIREMNRVGMMVDCSHSGYRTTMDAMSTSTQPCIFSHSNARPLYDHPRNIRDDQIKACAQTGGVIGINGVGAFIGEPRQVSVDTVVRHIDHIADLVGPQHIALGLDYMTPAHVKVLIDFYHGDTMPKVGLAPEMPWGFLSPSDTPLLLSKLLAKGYSADVVRGIMGENFLRVAAAVWH